jgi:mRNA interferase MazF
MLPYHPKTGQVLYCDYHGCIYPEMDKKRFVVVISPKFGSRSDLCTVVPLSTTPPQTIEKFHHILSKDPYPDSPEGTKVWAKCDMLMTVSFARLSGWWDEKVEGKRVYVKLFVSKEDLLAIRKCVLYALGLGGLTQYLG